MSEKRAVSRREFLKIAGLAGAAIGVAGGLGGIVAACGESTETSTTAAPATTAGPTTTAGPVTTVAPTTTVSSGAAAGREIKVGVVVPKTGALAAFATPFDFVLEKWTEALKDGVVCGDGQNHPVKILTVDTQSDIARCAAVTGDLINNEKVDLVIAGGAPDTMNPAADQCEASGVPGMMIQGPWQAFYFGRGGAPDKNPFKWAYALCVGIEAMAGCFLDMWGQIPNNKKVGLLYSNSTDGQAWADDASGGPSYFKQAGYALDKPGLYQPGTEDYTQQVQEFKKFGAEICSGAASPPDFTNFWKQAIQQGFKPKICTVGQALNFAETVSALGPIAYGLTTEISWHPSYPYKSSLSGETCQQIADAYEARTGRYWSAELIIYSLMEWFVDALKRTKNVDDKEAVLAAITSTKMETMYGPVDWSIPVDAAAQTEVAHPVPNCLRMPTAGGQWLKGEKWDFEKFLVSNKYVPGAEITKKIQEIQYSAS
jgi:branched-chain amino acid transport system substrate-binding protein